MSGIPLKVELDQKTGLFFLGYGYGSSPYFTKALFGDGTAAAPSISFLSDPTTGWYKFSAGMFGFAVGGVISGYFTNDNNANGGLRIYGNAAGSITPQITLGYLGNIGLSAAGTNQNITLTPSGTGYSVINGTVNNVALALTNTTNTVIDGTIYFTGSSGLGGGGPWITAGTQPSGSVAGSIKFGYNSLGNVPSVSILAGGNVLFGTSTDSSNGRLQLATHTTSAGGIGFGTDTSIFRDATGVLVLNGTGSVAKFYFSQGGVYKGDVQASGNNVYLSTADPAGQVIFRSGAAGTALTLDSSQGATFVNKVVSTNATAGIGYATGAGGTVTQLTSKVTAFTLSKICGQITFAADALAANTTTAGATWTNTAIAATDTVVWNHVSGGTLGAYDVLFTPGAGTCTVRLRNVTAGSLSEAPVVQFSIIKSVQA